MKGNIKENSVVKIKHKKGADGFTLNTIKVDDKSSKNKKDDSEEVIKESREDNP